MTYENITKTATGQGDDYAEKLVPGKEMITELIVY